MKSAVTQPAPAALPSGRVVPNLNLSALLDAPAVLTVAAALIIATLWWCLHQGYNVLLSYADVPTHLNLARRVHDNLHPGLGQLGAYWLPLAHVIELPFIWIDPLWHSDLAGAIPSMGCYLLSVWLLYHLALLATGERMPAVIAALAFAANPNVLYLHVLAMFEPAIIASTLMAVYLMARWLNAGGFGLLMGTAAAMSVACMSRYEIWAVAVASAPVIVIALWQAGERGVRLRGRLLLYLTLAWFGMAMWLVWNLALQGDPLYFLHPSFNNGLAQDRLIGLTKRHIFASISYVYYSVADNAGGILIALGAFGLWRYAATYGIRARGLWLYLLAMPAAFDAFYLWFKGTPPILVPQLLPGGVSGNIRYGVVTMPLLCLLAAFLARSPRLWIWSSGPAPAARLLVALRRMLRWLWPLIQIGLLGLVLLQPLKLIKGNDVVSFTEANTTGHGSYRESQQMRTDVAHWLGAHYDGGLILMSSFKGADRIILDSGLPDFDFINEGSQNTWVCALAVPQRWVRWVVLYKRGDGAARVARYRAIGGGEYFTKVADIGIPPGKQDGYWIFKRNSRVYHSKHGGCGK